MAVVTVMARRVGVLEIAEVPHRHAEARPVLVVPAGIAGITHARGTPEYRTRDHSIRSRGPQLAYLALVAPQGERITIQFLDRAARAKQELTTHSRPGTNVIDHLRSSPSLQRNGDGVSVCSYWVAAAFTWPGLMT